MKEIFYKKVGRKYVPVSEYDNELLDSFPKGAHLVQVYPGGSSRRFNINPNYAAMIAAGRIAEDAISKAIHDAGEIRQNNRGNRPLTDEQREAWEHLVKVFGDDAKYLEFASVREHAEAGVKAMMEEAQKLLSNPAVKKAYEHFQLVCELTKEHNEP